MDADKVAGKVARVAVEVAGRAVGIRGAGNVMRLLEEPQSRGWDPVVPADLHANPLPPVAEDGTAECWQCKTRLPFAQLDIAGNAYSCRPCMLRTAQANASHDAAAIDVDTVKIGRGRWWLWPLGALALTGLIVAIFFVTKAHSL
ncbi:MAG TPA: hypothetical protein VFV99_31020 [Kofleriaceae bacterium]|nr:hypothetical protein [Kofleriaceae bacterium]